MDYPQGGAGSWHRAWCVGANVTGIVPRVEWTNESPCTALGPGAHGGTLVLRK